MSFASPLLLWGLLALVPLIAVYLLKVRPARKPVTAWFLWEQIFEERRARALFQRFRDLLSLLLVAAVLAAAVLAAARPFWTHVARRDMILLIDNSPSMMAAEGLGTRLDRAKRIAADLIRSLDGSQRCSIASVAGDVVFWSGLSDNPRELLDAVQRIQPSMTPSSVVGLVPWAEGHRPQADPASASTAPDSSAGPRLILISDGCLGGPVPPPIELLKVGSGPSGNVGFIHCDVQRLPLPNQPMGVFFQIASTFDDTVPVDLEVYHETLDQLVRMVPLEVQPGVNPPEVFRVEQAPAGRWLLRLAIRDALSEDNLVYAVLPSQIPIDVAVVAESRYFYDHCVQSFSHGEAPLRLTPVPQAQLVVAQGNTEVDDLAPETGVLIIQPHGESAWWRDAGEEFAVAIPIVLDDEHPVVRHVEATAFPWIGARRLQAPPGAEILVMAEDKTPLLYRAVVQGRRGVVVNLDPSGGEFFLSPCFPALVYSAAAHLVGRSEPLPANCAAGDHVSLPSRETGRAATWTFPDGTTEPQWTSTAGPLDQLGWHTLGDASGDWTLGCSLLSVHETLLDNRRVEDSSQPLERGRSPVAWLTLLAIALLIVESMLYHRRRVG